MAGHTSALEFQALAQIIPNITRSIVGIARTGATGRLAGQIQQAATPEEIQALIAQAPGVTDVQAPQVQAAIRGQELGSQEEARKTLLAMARPAYDSLIEQFPQFSEFPSPEEFTGKPENYWQGLISFGDLLIERIDREKLADFTAEVSSGTLTPGQIRKKSLTLLGGKISTADIKNIVDIVIPRVPITRQPRARRLQDLRGKSREIAFELIGALQINESATLKEIKGLPTDPEFSALPQEDQLIILDEITRRKPTPEIQLLMNEIIRQTRERGRFGIEQ